MSIFSKREWKEILARGIIEGVVGGVVIAVILKVFGVW